MNYLQSEPDETLVLLTLAGEQTAYEALVTRYQNRVILSAASVTKSRFLAEDAAQDAFVSAWMKLNTLTDPEKFGAWVCRIAKNCALNMISRYRRFLPLETVENTVFDGDISQDPEKLYAETEERNEVGASVDKLPERVGEIIRLHYYEGLSVAEIADRMRISAGTVKWQLHEGRKQIRKELCAMDEKYGDTLVRRVMKKVEELKLWQLPNDKSGFETVYRDVLREVEELPECAEKQHALADVLMRGWWWLPGKKNDAMLARIAEAAEAGKNEEVMGFLVEQEDNKVWGDARVEFIRDKQIPRLEKAGFPKLLGTEWFRLGSQLLRDGKTEEGLAALAKAETLLSRGGLTFALLPGVRKAAERKTARFKPLPEKNYELGARAEECRVIDGGLRYWKEEYGGSDGELFLHPEASELIRNAARCDSFFFAGLSLGGTLTGSDGTTLSFRSDKETVETPAGRFENCALFEVRQWDWGGKTVCRTWYRDGVGIVRQELVENGVKTVHTLSAYEIKGGKGLLPLAEGNRWEYGGDYLSDKVSHCAEIAVAYAEEDRVILTTYGETERSGYDETSWTDTVRQIANEYYTETEGGGCKIRDIYDVIDRAEALAGTPFQKAYTKAAASTARRILDTDPTFRPGCPVTGHWNFFHANTVRKQNGRVTLSSYDGQYGFEWKHYSDGVDALLYNDVYGILCDAANALWSEEWRIGASPVVEYDWYGYNIRTKITCEDGGEKTVKAGTFANCLKLTLDSEGLKDGLGYRSGKKVYWFADGVGIIRTENEVCEGKNVVYELTSYSGTGEGYMPLADGMTRRYEGLDLTDGYFGAADYAYAADEDGDIVIFAEQTGIRRLPPPITEYGFIEKEQTEERLWNEGKHEESRLCHDTNNFRLMCHFLGRQSRYWGVPEKAIAWNLYRLKTIESFGGGTVPEAWLGCYAAVSFRTACALFGCGRKEEGYEWLEKAFEAFPKWEAIPDGTETETGDPMIFGGIRFVKGKNILRMPDGTAEPVSDAWLFNENIGLLHYGLTAPSGWEWFNPVRGEEKYKEYVARAEKIAEAMN